MSSPHQVLQTRDMSRPETGVKLNWTVARAGQTRNVIPAEARAEADVRVLRVADYDGLEAALRERIGTSSCRTQRWRCASSPAAPRSRRRRPRARSPGTRRRSTGSSARNSSSTTSRRAGDGRRLRGARDQERRGRALRAARLRRPLERRGIRPRRQHRAAALLGRAPDHGCGARQGALKARPDSRPSGWSGGLQRVAPGGGCADPVGLGRRGRAIKDCFGC